MKDSKHIGNLTELQCITRFIELGYSVSIPYGDSDKYDFVLDANGNLYKLQCKHAKFHYDDDGNVSSISFKTYWSSGYTKNKPSKRHKYTKNDCDLFVTHYNGKNYLVPVEHCSLEKTLRISNPKNNQQKGVNFLENFVDEVICNNLARIVG